MVLQGEFLHLETVLSCWKKWRCDEAEIQRSRVLDKYSLSTTFNSLAN